MEEGFDAFALTVMSCRTLDNPKYIHIPAISIKFSSFPIELCQLLEILYYFKLPAF